MPSETSTVQDYPQSPLASDTSRSNQVYKGDNLLFLDVDGVINSNYWIWTHSGREHIEDKFARIDPSRVEIVNTIVKLFECKVVISSVWRILFTVPELRRGLRSKGATFWNRIVDRTDNDGGVRGEQIARYCQKYPDSKIVILDDSTDMAHLMPYLVQTNPDTGIMEADIERVRTVFDSQVT